MPYGLLHRLIALEYSGYSGTPLQRNVTVPKKMFVIARSSFYG